MALKDVVISYYPELSSNYTAKRDSFCSSAEFEMEQLACVHQRTPWNSCPLEAKDRSGNICIVVQSNASLSSSGPDHEHPQQKADSRN